MRRKLISLLLVVFFLISAGGTVFAEERELVKNGSFEDAANGQPLSWGVTGGKWGESFLLSDDTHTGKSALQILTEESVFASQTIRNLIPGREYSFKFWLKVLSAGEKGPAVKAEFYQDSEYVSGGPVNILTVAHKRWTEVEYSFKVPETANSAMMLLRVLEGGDVLWDDVSMIGETTAPAEEVKLQEKEEETPFEAFPPLEGEENLLLNGDFEKVTASGALENVASYKNDWTDWIMVEDNEERGGKVLHEKDEYSSNNPWVRFTVQPVLPGAEYMFTAWLKTENFDGGYAGIKLEFYDSKGEYVSERLIRPGETYGQWKQVGSLVPIPLQDIASLQIYIRLYGAGDIYWDDAQFYMTKRAVHFTVDTGFFYYTDEPTAMVKTTRNTVTYAAVPGSKYAYTLKDGETVLASYTAEATDEFIWKFPTTLLTEIGKSYFVEVRYLDTDGNEIEKTEEEILIYKRPKNLTKDGIVLDNEGNPFNPVMGYHASIKKENYRKAKEMGMNVQQCVAQSSGISTVKMALDLAQQEGIMLLVPLYPNMKPAGHPDNAQLNIECIQAIKDHPALLGYMVMDEPFYNGADVGGVDATYTHLKNSYKLIREYDQEHLIYICECAEGYFDLVANVTDVLAIDPYIGKNLDQIGTRVAEHTHKAVRDADFRKPVWTIVQAWRWMGVGADDWVPSSNDVRSFLYQALFAGSNGLGYYRVNYLGAADEDPKEIWEYDHAEGIQCFADREVEDAFKAFVTGEYPTFAQNKDEESKAWYKLFVKGDSIYAIVLNREDEENSVDIPLVSPDGSVQVKSFTAEADDISGAPRISGADTLSVTLSPNQAIRYKLTVSEDLSGITTSKYKDIYTYEWAKKAIDTLSEKGIVNDKGLYTFAPGEEITRGDFAMFLIRTLGLTADSTKNFADVVPGAEYADAVRIGKALGILKGTDGVNFLPDAKISRQDLMVIVARGMRLKKTLEAGEETTFTDEEAISDYAVTDIAAMVRANIVNGYEDGTVRPLGNINRAEAAVIMYRILQWCSEP